MATPISRGFLEKKGIVLAPELSSRACNHLLGTQGPHTRFRPPRPDERRRQGTALPRSQRVARFLSSVLLPVSRPRPSVRRPFRIVLTARGEDRIRLCKAMREPRGESRGEKPAGTRDIDV